VIERLKRLNALSVSDALEAFGIKGVALGIRCLVISSGTSWAIELSAS
jgi:hypothetical protein